MQSFTFIKAGSLSLRGSGLIETGRLHRTQATDIAAAAADFSQSGSWLIFEESGDFAGFKDAGGELWIY